MRSILKNKNKRGSFIDLFLFMIIAVILVFVSAIMIYIGLETQEQLEETLGGKMIGDANTTEVIQKSMGDVNNAYDGLYWISVMLIIGMIISIFIGSYLVTTKPIFFIPYIFIVIIAIVVSVGISMAYSEVIEDPTLASTFAKFVGANFILSKLPMWIAVIGITGGIIMFVRMGSKENNLYGGYGGY